MFDVSPSLGFSTRLLPETPPLLTTALRGLEPSAPDGGVWGLVRAEELWATWTTWWVLVEGRGQLGLDISDSLVLVQVAL